MDFDERLIDEVRKFSNLYNTSCSNYKDSEMAQQSWQTIALSTNRSVKDCKDRWKYLRDQYAKKKKSMEGRSGDPGGKRHKWRFYDSLAFLSEHIKHRQTDTNIR